MDIGNHRSDFFALIGRLGSVNEGAEPGGDGRGGFVGEKVSLSKGSGSSLPRGKKRSTVGRLCDLPWIVETTYSRFFRRPTVGRFLTPSEVPCQAGWRGPLLGDEDEGLRRMRSTAPDPWGVPNGDFPNFAPSSQRGASGKPQDDLQTRKPGTYAGPILIWSDF